MPTAAVPKTINIKTDLYWGQKIYLKNDIYQTAYELIGLTLRPGGADGKNTVIFSIDYLGEDTEVYDFQCTTERDENQYLKGKEEGGGGDE